MAPSILDPHTGLTGWNPDAIRNIMLNEKRWGFYFPPHHFPDPAKLPSFALLVCNVLQVSRLHQV